MLAQANITVLLFAIFAAMPAAGQFEIASSLEPARLSSKAAQEKSADTGATIRFREKPACTSAAVTLGDLIEVVGGKNGYLESSLTMVVSPAPQVGAAQRWHKADVLQHLELRGIHPSSLNWMGPDETQLQRRQAGMVDMNLGLTPSFVSPRQMQTAKDNTSIAIAQYITYKTGEKTAWEVETEIPDAHVKTLQNRRAILQIGGGAEDYLGDQEFILQVRDSKGKLSIVKVRSRVKLPEMVVVASRPIHRDEVLQANALKMKVLHKSARKAENYYTSMEALVGKQIRRSLSTGLPLTEQMVGEPIIVSRGSLLTVESVSGGITVSSPGKALSPGAAGDLVEVELPGRVKVFGTIVDSDVVRIAARATPSQPRK